MLPAAMTVKGIITRAVNKAPISPMAFVILGGLTTSTLLNLLVVPALFARFGNVRVNAAE